MYSFVYYVIFAILATLFILYVESMMGNIDTSGTQTINIDGVEYIFPDIKIREREPRLIKDIGSKLVCESLEEIIDQKVKYNSQIPGLSSLISKDYVYADCHEPNTKIMADYKPKDLFLYEGKSNYNSNFYEFYDRLALDAYKTDNITKKKFHYIEVPYTIDICDEKEGKMHCDVNMPFSVRKRRIKTYMKEKMKNIF